MTSRRRCWNGHDLTLPGAVLDDRYCARCREATERDADRRRIQRRRSARGQVLGTTERLVSRQSAINEMQRRVLLETAPAWVLKASREEQDRWLATLREEQLRPR